MDKHRDAKKEIISNLKKAVAEVVFDGRLPRSQSSLAMTEDYKIELQEPKDEAHGDYTSNIAMAIFASSKSKTQSAKPELKTQSYKNPLELAEQIAKILNTKYQIPNTIDRITAVAPGFINFYLSKEYLMDQLQDIVPCSAGQGLALQPRNQAFSGKRIMVEFTDPNPFKEFHIGHLYSNAVGESISRLLESQGAEVWRVTYQGDVGLHVAKAIWGIKKLGLESVILANEVRPESDSGVVASNATAVASTPPQNDDIKKKVELLGKAYAAGAKAYEEDPQTKEEINMLNKKIYEITNKEIATDDRPRRSSALDLRGLLPQNDIANLYQKGREWSLEYFESIYKRLGSTFVKNYFESVAGPIGLALVKDHLKDNIFKESEGAVIFEGEKYGLHNRVFINSLGLPTYEAKDMGLPEAKYKDFKYDQSIIITAHEQSAYFQVVLKALSFINPDLAAKTMHLGHGMVRLPQGKMSSRTGNVITGEWLLDEAKQLITQNYSQMDKETAEKVAVGAVKWALLKNGIGRDIAFSFQESISLEGNSGPYLQYTYARTCSVVAKAGGGWQVAGGKELLATSHELQAEEVSLLRAIVKFPEVLEEAARTFSPNTVCTYLFDLGQKFNLFYQKCPILGSKEQDFRLAITAGTGQVIKNGLFVLGIQSPEKM